MRFVSLLGNHPIKTQLAFNKILKLILKNIPEKISMNLKAKVKEGA